MAKLTQNIVVSVQKGGWIGLPPLSLSDRWSTSNRSRMLTTGKAALPHALNAHVFCIVMHFLRAILRWIAST